MAEKAINPQVSFVLPAFNEGAVIEYSLERLDRVVNGNGLAYEIVVVDDGSYDDTRLRAMRYASQNSHVRVIGYDRNMGKGFAVKKGFWKCRGEFVIFVDSDSEVSFDVVNRYIEALKDADMVIGSKWHKDSIVDASLVRKLLSRGFNVLVRLLTGLRVCDTQCGIKAVRREAFEKIFRRLSVKRYAFDVELLVLAKLHGLTVVELPVKVTLKNRFSFREIWRMFLDLLSIAYRLRVKRWHQRGIA
ncbi:MAG: glycosyltransferase [Candidatus Bathyarchaeia archaeon]